MGESNFLTKDVKRTYVNSMAVFGSHRGRSFPECTGRLRAGMAEMRDEWSEFEERREQVQDGSRRLFILGAVAAVAFLSGVNRR